MVPTTLRRSCHLTHSDLGPRPVTPIVQVESVRYLNPLVHWGEIRMTPRSDGRHTKTVKWTGELLRLRSRHSTPIVIIRTGAMLRTPLHEHS